MEKSFKLKLTEDQKREIAQALGVSIDQVAVQVAYAQALTEDAKSNDASIANVAETAKDGNVWIVEQLNMLAEAPDGTTIPPLNLDNVAGGVKLSPSARVGETPRIGDKSAIRFNPGEQPGTLQGQTPTTTPTKK